LAIASDDTVIFLLTGMRVRVNLSLQSTDMPSAMLVSDKHGHIFFFPWGRKRKGYLLKSVSQKLKIKETYSIGFIVNIALLIF
jgi:hypothetical protein